MDNIVEAGSTPSAPAATEPSVVPSLLRISKATRNLVSLKLAEIGLYPGQDQLLDTLDLEKPMAVSELAAALSVRPSTISKMIERLLSDDLVIRCETDADKRRSLIKLSPKGARARAAIRRVWREMEEYLLYSLPSEEVEQLGGALHRTEEVLTARLRRVRV